MALPPWRWSARSAPLYIRAQDSGRRQAGELIKAQMLARAVREGRIQGPSVAALDALKSAL